MEEKKNEIRRNDEIEALISSANSRALLKYLKTQKVKELIYFGMNYTSKNYLHMGLQANDIPRLKEGQIYVGESIRPFIKEILDLYTNGNKKNKKTIIRVLRKNQQTSHQQEVDILVLLNTFDIFVHLIHVGLAVKLAGLTLIKDGDGVIKEVYAFPLTMNLEQRRNVVNSPINNNTNIQKIRGLNIDRSAVKVRASQNIDNKKIIQQKYLELKQQMQDSKKSEILNAMLSEIKSGALLWVVSPNRRITSIESLKKIIFPLPK